MYNSNNVVRNVLGVGEFNGCQFETERDAYNAKRNRDKRLKGPPIVIQPVVGGFEFMESTYDTWEEVSKAVLDSL